MWLYTLLIVLLFVNTALLYPIGEPTTVEPTTTLEPTTVDTTTVEFTTADPIPDSTPVDTTITKSTTSHYIIIDGKEIKLICTLA